MLSASYLAAAASMCGAALYVCFRLGPFLTTTTMLLGSLLLICGPAYLSFMLSSGEPAHLIQQLSGSVALPNPIFPAIKGKVHDFDAVVIAMTFSIALMYVGIVAGIEIVDRTIPKRIAALQSSLVDWNTQVLHDEVEASRILLGVIAGLFLFMLFVSIREDHIGTIRSFLSASDTDGSRIAYRTHYGGSESYPYRVILTAIAPMFVIWGGLEGWLKRSWWLLLSAALLLVAIMIGQSETLSKAPPAFFFLQLILAATLTFTNRLTWRTTLGAVCAVTLVLFLIVRVAMTSIQGTEALEFVYSRVFAVPNQALLENFAVFPALHPHLWGANIRPMAALMGVSYTPSFTTVAQIWYQTTNETSVPALFIADAWADFSYAGVIVFSMIAGAVCRSIDAIFLVHGKTAVGVAVLGATFLGVYTLLNTALNIALFSGGLLLAPILAGLLVMAARRLGRRHPTSPAER